MDTSQDPETSSQTNSYIDKLCLNILEFIECQLKIENCKLISSIQSFDENIIQSGISPKLDQILEKHNTYTQNFKAIHSFLNQLIESNESNSSTNIEYIKIHETEKSGQSLQITKKRGNLFKQILLNLGIYHARICGYHLEEPRQF